MPISIDLVALGKGAMSLIKGSASKLFHKQKADSLVSLTQTARVEPITMIDETLRTAPYLEDVLHSLVSLFSGYYLQAIALTSTINNVSVVNRLDALNPNRSGGYRITGLNLGTEMLQEENYAFGLPRIGDKFGLEAYGLTALEARAGLEALVTTIEHGAIGDSSNALKSNTTPEIDAKTVGDIVQSAPLSVGKMLDVVITEENKSVRVPVSVRLLSTTVRPDVLTHILSDGAKNITWKDRWHGWRSGELDLWRDVILANDLIEEHRKAILKDTSGAYQEILNRRRGNTISAVLTATPSLATASNLMVISKATAMSVERKLHSKMNEAALRNKIFQMSYLMILAVVDTENEMVTFYHRGIALPTVVSIRELKVSAKGNGPDVADILTKLLSGKTPTL